MFADLLPAAAVTVAVTVDPPDAELFPEEAAQIERAVDSRRREFTTGRWCAREALAALGFGPAPLLSGGKREPLWPAGVVGAITHCTGLRAAVVARASELRAVGVDAEPDGPLPEGVLDAVSSPAERAHLAALGQHRHWDKLLFSTKESVYKAWFPITGRWLGFEEATLTFDLDGGFRARLHPDSPIAGEPTEFDGRWAVRDGLVLTAVAVPVAGG